MAVTASEKDSGSVVAALSVSHPVTSFDMHGIRVTLRILSYGTCQVEFLFLSTVVVLLP